MSYRGNNISSDEQMKECGGWTTENIMPSPTGQCWAATAKNIL